MSLARDLDVQAQNAFREYTGRDALATHESGRVWALRSLNIPDYSRAVIAYALLRKDGSWGIFPLPPKTKWGTFA
jgi:hypothetical protein